MFAFALRNLLSRPLRSTLATLGLAVAVAGMVGLFSVADGLDRMVDDAFGRIPGLVVVQRGAPIPLFSRLPAAWEREIAAIPGVRTVNAEVWARVNEIDGKRIAAPPRFFFGTDVVTRSRLRRAVYRDALVSGRFLTPADRGTNHCVVSRSIADEFGKGIGGTLVCNGHPLEIVGIYHTGSLLLDVAIIADITTVRRITLFSPAHVSCFY
ncbi:MAG: ABC transporter permease, partial [Planctomycetota bacterium]